ncbi:MAG TPA: arylsulfotransferase family protein [Solirubrobacteraceae bacterium]|nr:arylsulfotransferase family protein [Solirubrobacteraceae bacterium]
MPTRALLVLPLAAAAAVALLPATATTAASPASGGVTVSPFPGTPDASAQTQISFLGARGTRVMSVRAVGSRSGSHAGRIEEYSTGQGASFLPKRPFEAGENVEVTAVVEEGNSASTARTTFTVATPAQIDRAEFPAQPGNPADVQHYLSAPTLTPSTVSITTPARAGASPGDLFLAPYQGAGAPGPMITDQRGDLVWFHPLPRGEFATNFRPQRFDGRPVLTWWQGRILALGFGHAGDDEIYSSSYRPLAVVRAGNGYSADLHEFLLEPHETAWIDAFDPVETNLQRIGGSRHAIVTDSVVQLIDIKTGLVMWEWHALGHIPLSDSYTQMPRGSHHPWDYVHINSIDPGGGGQLLLSSRNTSALWDVSRATGRIIWNLGGRHSSFAQGPGTVFDFQHDATWQPGARIALFDDGYVVTHDTPSRGLLLNLDLADHRVTLAKRFANPLIKLQTESQGDLVRLPGDDWLVGYGGIPNFTEFDGSGHVLLDGTLGPFVENYRTYLAPWSGTPTTRPAAAAQLTATGINVEASWNGATAVASWEVLAGDTAGSLTAVATAPSSGFETTLHVAAASYVAVAARNAAGRVLSTSVPISVGG